MGSMVLLLSASCPATCSACLPACVPTYLQVVFERNWASEAGGAVAAYDGCRVEFSGQTSCHSNYVGYVGGCLRLTYSTVAVNGPFCAYSNTGSRAPVAWVQADRPGTILQVNAPFTVANNTPAESTIGVQGGIVQCGEGSDPWRDNDVNYGIQGPLCACSSEFSAGLNTTCDSCDGIGQLSPSCRCVSVVAPSSQAVR